MVAARIDLLIDASICFDRSTCFFLVKQYLGVMSVISGHNTLFGKSGWNPVEFSYHFNSEPCQFWNFHQNFIFPIVKFVPANLEHTPASLESSPAENSSNFMHRKMFPPFFCPPKLNLLVLSRY